MLYNCLQNEGLLRDAVVGPKPRLRWSMEIHINSFGCQSLVNDSH